LEALFGEIPKDLYFYLWDSSKITRWFRGPMEIPSALKYTEQIKHHKDVYVSCGLSRKALGPNRRTPADDVAGIVGAWVDVDIANEVHKKKNLPQTEAEALELLDMCGLKPSIIINSGHGLQAWWLFNEPWIFESEEQRDYASQFTASWIYSIRHRARAKGWDVDATIDLSRVLRLGGTFNRKNKRDIKEIRTLFFDPELRYEPEDMEGYILEDAWKAVENGDSLVKGSTYVAEFTLNPDADLSMKKWNALMENDERFQKSWEHNRKDLQDQSQSSYDLSLASIAVRAGWSDQEVVDLLIVNRQKHNQDLKLRPDYYQRTIARAKAGMYQTDDDNEDEISNIESIEKIQNDPTLSHEDKKALTLDGLSAELKVHITKIVKYLTDPPQLRIYTKDGNLLLQDAGDILNMNIFRRGMVNTCGKVIPSKKKDEWDKTAQTILNYAEPVEVDEDMTEFGGMESKLRSYLQANIPEQRKGIHRENAYIYNQPVVENDRILISLSDDFVPWYQAQKKERASDRQIGATLKAMGAESVRINLTIEGKRTTKNRWALPGGLERWGIEPINVLED